MGWYINFLGISVSYLLIFGRIKSIDNHLQSYDDRNRIILWIITNTFNSFLHGGRTLAEYLRRNMRAPSASRALSACLSAPPSFKGPSVANVRSSLPEGSSKASFRWCVPPLVRSLLLAVVDDPWPRPSTPEDSAGALSTLTGECDPAHKFRSGGLPTSFSACGTKRPRRTRAFRLMLVLCPSASLEELADLATCNCGIGTPAANRAARYASRVLCKSPSWSGICPGAVSLLPPPHSLERLRREFEWDSSRDLNLTGFHRGHHDLRWNILRTTSPLEHGSRPNDVCPAKLAFVLDPWVPARFRTGAPP